MRISDWSSDVCSSDLQQSDTLLRATRRLHLRGASQRAQAAGNAADGYVEHRCQEEAEEGHPQHAGEHRDAERLAHLGAGAGGERHRHHAENEGRSEEHTSELQSLMRISYAVFCLK